MATLLDSLDGKTEGHVGAEPRVVLNGIQRILIRALRPDEEDLGISVAQIADRADVSTRTVYRQLSPEDGQTSLSLDLADKLCRACGVKMRGNVELVWADGTVTDYEHVPVVG